MTNSSDPSKRVLLPLPESFPPGTRFWEVEFGDVMFAAGPAGVIKVDFVGNVFEPDDQDFNRVGMNGTRISEEEFLESARSRRRDKARSQNGE